MLKKSIVLKANKYNAILDDFYKQHKWIYFKYVFRMIGNYDISEDIIQESFFKILKNIHKIKNPAKMFSWGFQIVANTCRDWHRKKKKECIIYSDNINHIIPDEIINSEDMNEEIIAALNNILSKISHKERKIFILKSFNKLTYIDIARRVNLSEKTIRKYMKRNIVKFLNRFERLNIIKGKYYNINR